MIISDLTNLHYLQPDPKCQGYIWNVTCQAYFFLFSFLTNTIHVVTHSQIDDFVQNIKIMFRGRVRYSAIYIKQNMYVSFNTFTYSMEYVCTKSQCMLYILIVMICLKNLVVFLFIGYSLQITKTAFRRMEALQWTYLVQPRWMLF